MTQSWDDLIFLHWACDAQEVQSHLPKGLMVDTFDSQAHISIVGLFTTYDSDEKKGVVSCGSCQFKKKKNKRSSYITIKIMKEINELIH